MPTAAAYYLAITAAGGANTHIAERGRAAGRALGDDPLAHLRGLSDRVIAMLPAYADDYALVTIAGGMRLDEYLRTRVFVSSSTASTSRPPPVWTRASTRRRSSTPLDSRPRSSLSPDVGPLLLAVTGRGSFPADLTVV